MSPIKPITMAVIALLCATTLSLLWVSAPVQAQRATVPHSPLARQLGDIAALSVPRIKPAGGAASAPSTPLLPVDQLQAAISTRTLPKAERQRVSRLVEDLEAVATPAILLPRDNVALQAAQGEEDTATSNTGEEAPGITPPLDVAEDEQVKPAPPRERAAPVEPPVKREVKARLSSDSNTAIASVQHALDKDAAAGRDILAASGLSDGTMQAGAAGTYHGDPMEQPVNVDFREMQLSNAIALLAHKAGINVIAGTDLDTPITMYLRNVPLRQAIKTVLRSKGLGLLEQEGIYHVVTYEEAISAERETIMIPLENAKASELATVVTDIIKGTPEDTLTNVSTNDAANILVINGPKSKLGDLARMVHDLDVAEQVLPTVTEAIKLNYADAALLVPMVEKLLTPEIGNVTADERARHLVVTDVPVVLAQIRDLVAQLDIPVKQVLIDAMVVDAVLEDGADTGVDWILDTVRSQSRRQAALGQNGRFQGNLQELGLNANMNVGNAAGILNFGVLTDNFDWRGIIQAEVRNSDSRLLSNPRLRTIENKPATITISQEIPYVELTETNLGGSQTSTKFKDIGTLLEVTPRVTHDNHVIVDILGKESGTQGVFNNVPIEDKRQIETTARMMSGQTIYIGGLRKNDENSTIRKIPVLGNIPVVNFLFRSNQRKETATELLIFLTCTVVEEDESLTPHENAKYEEALNEDFDVNAERTVLQSIVHPNQPRTKIGGE